MKNNEMVCGWKECEMVKKVDEEEGGGRRRRVKEEAKAPDGLIAFQGLMI